MVHTGDQVSRSELPDGWDVVEEPGAPYYKIRKEALMQVERSSDREVDRPSTIVITDGDIVGISQGPGALTSWDCAEPHEVAVELAHEIQAWADEGGDPYPGPAFDERLDETVEEPQYVQSELQDRSMTHKITLEQEHNAHYDHEEGVYDDCYQVVVHCESEEEAEQVAKTVTEEVDGNGE